MNYRLTKKVTSELQIDKWLMNLQIDKKMWLVTTIWQMTKNWQKKWLVTTNWLMTKNWHMTTDWQKKWLVDYKLTND